MDIDVTGATIVFVMKNIATGEVFRIDATIVDGPSGRIMVTLTGTDYTTEGATFNAEWEITFADSTVLTVPEGFYHTVEVVPDLGEES